MKRLIPFLFALLLPALSHSQSAVRYEGNAYTVNSSAPQPGALYPVLAITNATVQICNYSTTVACPSLVTTYTDSTAGTACPTSAQLTPAISTNTPTCTATVDSEGGFGAWLKQGNYQYNVVTSYGTYGPYNFSVSTPSGIGACTSIDGVIYPQTNAGIQAAVNATPNGGCVFLPAGTYAMTATANQEIVISTPITITGAGWGTILQVASSVPTSVPVFRVLPPSTPSGLGIVGMNFQDFSILSASGAPASYGFEFDSVASGYHASTNVLINHINIGQGLNGTVYPLGLGAIWLNNSTNEIDGGFLVSHITNSTLFGGVRAQNIGDHVTLDFNLISGAPGWAASGYSMPALVDANAGIGASKLEILHNTFYVTNNCAIHLGGGDGVNSYGGTSAEIGGNIIQTSASPVATGCHGALVDLDGSSSTGVISNAHLWGNSIQSVYGSTLNGINMNYVSFPLVDGWNNIEIGASPAVGMTITANAGGVQVERNIWTVASSGAGATKAQAVSDLGSNTSYDWGNIPNVPVAFQDSTGQSYMWGPNGLGIFMANNANNITDGTTNAYTAGIFSNASSTSPHSGTWLSVYNFMANGNATVTGTTTLTGYVGMGITNPGPGKVWINDGTNRDFLVESDAYQLGSSGMAIAAVNDATNAFVPFSIQGNPITFGGGVPAIFNNGLNLYSTAAPLQFAGAAGTSGQCALSGGASTTPHWGACSGGATGAALTMNNSGSGAASGSTFNGGSAVTLSYNTIGAAGLAAANTFTAAQTINLNTAALPTPPTGTVLQVGNADGVVVNVESYSFGVSNGNSFSMWATGTGSTNASPTALLASQGIGYIGWGGYNGSAYTASVAAAIQGRSGYSGWTTSNTPTMLEFLTTPSGTTAKAEGMRLEPSGGLSVGTATFNATDPGQGNIAAQGSITGATLAPIAARRGTFVCTSGGSITVTNANGSSASDIIITTNTQGGTQTYAPNVTTPPNGTQFVVGCATLDTSTYNYDILN